MIEDMGFSATFAEWFDVGDQPGTFRLDVDVNEIGLTPKTLDELNRLIGDAKPVSRHLAQPVSYTHLDVYKRQGYR